MRKFSPKRRVPHKVEHKKTIHFGIILLLAACSLVPELAIYKDFGAILLAVICEVY